MKVRRITALSALALSALASHAQTPTSSPAVVERPWEVIADNGDMVLPDLYYSENSENEQVMPLQVFGRHQIDHLIYPTIGNPKLYFKDATNDSLMLVLRMEPSKLAALGAQTGTGTIHGRNLNPLTLNPSNGNSLRFFLVTHYVWGKNQRNDYNDVSNPGSIAGRPGVVELKLDPSRHDQIGIQPHYDGMPAALLQRETVRVYFDQKAMMTKDLPSGLPEGLYDIRVETTIGGQVTADSTYNGAQIFEHAPRDGEAFTALNFSDAQVNTGWIFAKKATPHLGELVKYINTSSDPTVKDAKYVTFNGDLHDGGAVLQRYPRGVGEEYAKEAEEIFGKLRDLNKPVFLTCGNHDGYVSMGHVPPEIQKVTEDNDKKNNSDEKKLFDVIAKHDPKLAKFDPAGLDTLQKVVEEVADSGQSTWPVSKKSDLWPHFFKYLQNTETLQGGYHLDIFQGQHARTVGNDFSSWHKIPIAQRNMVFYDGQYQWRKTYGPLYYDYSFGKSHFLSLNSFELRQHWRSGWGMYTVNYGGGMSEVQMDWVKRELARFADSEVTIFAHHDPRGGHNGKDYPYFFGYVDFGAQTAKSDSAASQVLRSDYYTNEKCGFSATKEQRKECEDKFFTDHYNGVVATMAKRYGAGVASSMWNFTLGDSIEPLLCKGQPVADNDVAELGCMHDGLQEWMTRDASFDCFADARYPFDDDDAKKDATHAGRCKPGRSWYSGYELLNLITTNTNVRTLVLGHTHFNSIDEYQVGDELVPNHVTLGVETLHNLENSGPMRTGAISDDGKNGVTSKAHVNVTYPFQRVLQAPSVGGFPRELVILRVTTAADLTSQYVGTSSKEAMYGFQALTFSSPTTPTTLEGNSLNHVDFFRNMHDGKSSFERLMTSSLNIDRSAEMRAANGMGTRANCLLVQQNPLHYTFRLGKGKTYDTRKEEPEATKDYTPDMSKDQVWQDLNPNRANVYPSYKDDSCDKLP